VSPEAVIVHVDGQAVISDDVLCASYLPTLPVLFLSSLTPVITKQTTPPDTTTVIIFSNTTFFDVDWVAQYSDWLRTGRSGDRIPVGGEIFRTCPDRSWGPPSLLHNGYRVSPGGKERPGRDADPLPPSSPVGHERVELYLYSPYGPYGLYRASMHVQGCTLPLHFTSFD